MNIHKGSPTEAADVFPIGDLSDVTVGSFIPDDGRVNPIEVTMSLANGARIGGTRNCKVVAVAEIIARKASQREL